MNFLFKNLGQDLLWNDIKPQFFRILILRFELAERITKNSKNSNKIDKNTGSKSTAQIINSQFNEFFNKKLSLKKNAQKNQYWFLL